MLDDLSLGLRGLALAASLALLGSGLAQAGTASVTSFNGGVSITHSAPGFASAAFSDSRISGMAHADEYTGGVGAFASAIGRFAGMAAQATASYSTSFIVDCVPAPFDLSCGMDFTMVLTGDASAHGNHNSNPLVFGSAEAGYTAVWSVDLLRRVDGARFNVSGGGESHFYFRDNGNTETVVVGNPFTSTHMLQVEPGDLITLSLRASAGAFTDPSGFFPPDMGSASATANFSNTLRWGGVNGAYSSTGQLLDMSQFHLVGADGFDYVNPAGLNPFATPVPEPASGFALLGGLGVIAVRRRQLR